MYACTRAHSQTCRRELEPWRTGRRDLLILDPWGREAPETQRLEFCRLEGSRVTLQGEEWECDRGCRGRRGQVQDGSREGRLGPAPPPAHTHTPHPRSSPAGQFGGQLGEEVGGGARPPGGQGCGLVGQSG